MPYQLAGARTLAATLSPGGSGTWTAMTLLNTWTNAGGSETTAQYRFWALINEVEVIGNISHAAVTGASQFATLPFTPATNQRRMLGTWNSTNSFAAATTTPGILLSTAGALSAVALPAGTTNLSFHAFLSLDA